MEETQFKQLICEVKTLQECIKKLPEIIAVAVTIETEKAKYLSGTGQRYSDLNSIKDSLLPADEN